MEQKIRNILTSLGFTQAKGQSMLYEKKITEIRKINVDFRRPEHAEKGRRFINDNGNFDADPNTEPDLVEFKRLRDEALQSSKNDPEDKSKREASSGNLGQVNPFVSTQTSSLGVQSPPAPHNSNKTVWDELAVAYEFDIVELFGNAGDGKSKTALKIAMDAIAQGKKVKYIDTERGFLKSEREKLGSGYQYISNMAGLMQYVKNIPTDIDLLVVDSVGYPVLTEWAKFGQNEKGNSLTQIIAIKDMIKDWAISNNKIALVINQPDSDFGKAADYVNRPFGDKGQFVIKEVFRIERQKTTVTSAPMTKSLIKVFRSRHDARDVIVATVEITNDGVTIK